ncbi:PTS transporter subunit EIIB [Mammaliicoccus stepanovicii]|uniref:PTS system, N-acetylglucosamine-specific IIB component / PTS system, N-acetylglucosamine-specific IIC component n=1 Tax=Mammaliicoccus stepanovicii TaxID=643214 RepID=A0A239Y6Z7_9STAP|nr:PTS glucose/sucrose transporter subunit IIB [Mammaliicoccus stepanovicii]PNZ77213.1 hypothetical protein CD111_04695 [Mammaliicoccus stepanovicii]GGI43221.1 hypothetical protein GCM10010896_22350 [Mammaliicoccus stepanovicii]SNV54815.1 PTS system, N-acetylglucosamine-specific IIB component / PTS system, N-acetylglucosamine-specific IIC component [Mammaliicoccus stepanovicii]
MANVGGPDNVMDVENCMIRLRFELSDTSLINEDKIKQIGAHGTVIIDKHHAQIVIGPEVNKVSKYLIQELET